MCVLVFISCGICTTASVALIELSNGLRVMGRVTGDADIGRAVRFSGTRESSLGISLVFEVKD